MALGSVALGYADPRVTKAVTEAASEGSVSGLSSWREVELAERLCAMIGQADLPKDARFATAAERPRHIPIILDLMTQWFRERPFEKALAELKAADIPHSPIMSMAEIFTDPHYRAREMLIDVPVEGLGTLTQPGVIPKLSLTPGRVDHAGASLGSHTDEVLTGLLKMTPAEIADLRASGAV